MTKDDFSINFTGVTHDHTILPPTPQASCANNNGQNQDQAPGSTDANNQDQNEFCSTIAILRRHPMYDCLVLVKKYRVCLDGHTLEFPVDKIGQQSQQNQQGDDNVLTRNCGRRRLVSRFLDGDDPMYQSACNKICAHLGDSGCNLRGRRESPVPNLSLPFESQIDDNGCECELVHVPINGLLDRLKSYTEAGVAVDSRVYAFAMGLKTAERILTTNSMKELQETPI